MKFLTTFIIIAIISAMALLSVSCAKDTATVNNNELIIRQDNIILQYFNEKKITNFQKHSTGFYYTISQTNSNTKPSLGDSLATNYTGNVLYGKVFDSNLTRTPYIPLSFRYLREKSRSGSPLTAYQDGAALLAKGEKGMFYFPSRLLYGANPPQGNSLVTPNTILVFEIEVVDVFKQ